jgi:hypothetical protein
VNVPDLADAAERHAAALAVPAVAGDQPWAGQSLGGGSAGVSLLHIERAWTGHGTWRQAHAWITRAAAGAISASDRAGLYQGAPAIGFILDTAARGSCRYRAALAEIDRHLTALTLRRAATAMTRIGAGALPVFGEYDIFTGLTGLGALQLRRDPGGPALEAVLRYLVALTRSLRADGGWLPSWWVSHDPHRRHSPEFPGGHSNLGAAHQTTWRATLAPRTPARSLPKVWARCVNPGPAAGSGFLEGNAGIGIALHTATHRLAATGWDAALLIDSPDNP